MKRHDKGLACHGQHALDEHDRDNMHIEGTTSNIIIYLKEMKMNKKKKIVFRVYAFGLSWNWTKLITCNKIKNKIKIKIKIKGRSRRRIMYRKRKV